MKITTTRFGALEINEQEIITFTQGPIGLAHAQRYVRLSNQLGEETPFRWLQSVENPDLAFVIVDPLSFLPEYQVNLKKDEVQDLEIVQPDDVRVYCVVVIPERAHDMTANLRAPILLNEKKFKAKQLILSDPALNLRYKIMEEMENKVKSIQTVK
jgi:flagellar assembly factor FliW